MRRARGAGGAITLALVASVVVASPARADEVRDRELGFTLTLPAEFRDFPEGLAQRGTKYAWIRGARGSEDFAIVGIEPMGGVIGREPLRPERMPLGMKVRRAKWGDVDVDVMGGPMGPVFVEVAQVPLVPQAVQLKIVGPAARQAELTALMGALLGQLHGKSNWLSAEQRSYRLGKVVGLVVGMVLVGLWMLRRRRASARG